MKSFDQLFKELDWKPIRHCPGRFVLGGSEPCLSPSNILGEDVKVAEHMVAAARDTVLVLRFADGGGLISYRRADGSLLHTLNAPEGFERKLRQLGIEHKG